MQRVFKHPQIFTDLLTLSQMYYPMHHNLPKPFRYAVGERILSLEQTGSEQTWSAGAKLDFNQVARAFKLQDKAALFRRQDAAPVSLGDAGSTLIKIIVVMMLVLAGMWLLAAMFGASSSGSGRPASRATPSIAAARWRGCTRATPRRAASASARRTAPLRQPVRIAQCPPARSASRSNR